VAFRLQSNGELQRQVDHLKMLLDSAAGERQKLEERHESVIEQLNCVRADYDRLQSVHCELQRQRDQLSDEKQDLDKDVERQQNENERWLMFSVTLM